MLVASLLPGVVGWREEDHEIGSDQIRSAALACLVVSALIAGGFLARPSVAVAQPPSHPLITLAPAGPWISVQFIASQTGCTRVLPTSVTTTSHGATHYGFPNGTEQVVPPPHFDPLTATTQQLLSYGYPLIEASISGQLHSHLTTPQIRVIGYNDCPNMPVSGQVGASTSPNWSGYMHPAYGANAEDVNGIFTQPQVNVTGCNPSVGHAISTWVGLGGDASTGSALLQTGGIKVTYPGTPHLFAEWISSSGVNNQASGPTLNPGTPAAPEVSWVYNGGTNGTFTYDDTYGSSFQ